MIPLKGSGRIFLILSSLFLIVIGLARCMNTADALPKDPRGENYAGAKACMKCHQDLSSSYAHSAHGLTSSPVVNAELLAVFDKDSNMFSYDLHRKVMIEQKDNGIFQTAYLDGKQVRSEQFDIVFGSGEKAYTYGYWKGKKLYELPLSYFSSIHNWAISPGFPGNDFYFERGITSRCIECHGSYVENKLIQKSAFSQEEEMEKGSIIFGVDCERCHGPAKEHVVFHTDNPAEKLAKFITLFKSLTRKQKMDACGLCHSGNTLMRQKSVFSFKPGDDLDDYYVQDFTGFGGADPDVHGNQSTMLQRSACYVKSAAMNCQSCHQTHEDIKGNLTAYSQRCMSCHPSVAHSKGRMAKGILTSNCIDCHMPKVASKMISFKQAGRDQVSPYPLRSHRIAVY